MDHQSQMFGGSWTEKKLTILGGYFDAYTQALKNKPFELVYLDAFAGTGYRRATEAEADALPLFPELADEEAQEFMDGSARISLQIRRPFDRYVFVERSGGKAKQLEDLKIEFPDIAHRINVVSEDCNAYIQQECGKRQQTRRRMVLFLDPFGMQVEWDTMQAIASTSTIDAWVLFPVSAVNRLLQRDASIPDGWSHRLNTLFGTTAWYDAFYREQTAGNLFGTETHRVCKCCSMADISKFYEDRLQNRFAQVASNPKWLRNKRTPLFVLFFAMTNPSPKAQRLALRIAGHLLEAD